MCNYEMWNIRKPMVLERVEVNLLKSAHYYYKQNWKMIPYLFNQFEKASGSGKICEVYLKLGLHFNFPDLANIDRSCCRVWKVVISFSNLVFSDIKRITTHYQTQETWIGLNITCYHSLNALPHALPYILYQLCLVLGYLQLVTTCYHRFFLKIVIYIVLWIYCNAC